MAIQKTGGQFFGRTRITNKSENGGARHVFAHIKGWKNDLVWAPWGGVLQNPFPGAAKLYAADPVYIQYDDKCENPKLYCLKTYEAVSATGTTLNIVRDGYHHLPFVTDNIGVAPTTLGGAMTVATVMAVAKTEVDGKKVWQLTLDKALTVKEGDILVEADKDNKMLVKDINGFLPCDYDFCYEPVADPTDDDNYEDADYAFTPVAGILAYTHRMSPLPQCVLKLNQCKWNGIFGFNALP